METRLELTPKAQKGLKVAPPQVQVKFRHWADRVQMVGLKAACCSPGLHDEPLSGQRKGERSIRLNRQWRAIYRLDETGTLCIVEILEVTPHDYRKH